jgi:IMP dehydrogenase/GMP reductase
MAGSIFAGTEESPGETIIYEGRKFKSYRGMGSVEAMQEGSKDRYFQDMEADIKKLVPEGIVGRVPYKGSLSEVVQQFIGGLRAGMGYCGAKDIATLQNESQFIRITAASMAESHPARYRDHEGSAELQPEIVNHKPLKGLRWWLISLRTCLDRLRVSTRPLKHQD